MHNPRGMFSTYTFKPVKKFVFMQCLKDLIHEHVIFVVNNICLELCMNMGCIITLRV
jgi:hypothetical protein